MPSLDDQLLHWAQTAADRPFVVEVETGRVLTYGQCLAAVVAMRQVLGEAPQTVALGLPSGIAAAVIWLSSLCGGHRLVPVAPSASDRERGRIRTLFDPEVVIVAQPDDARGLSDGRARVLTQAQWEQHLRAAARMASDQVAAGSDQQAPGSVLLHTSGTTGEPKWVNLDAGRIAHTADAIRVSHRLTETDRGFSPLPFNHVTAPVVSLCASLMAGATVLLAPHFSRHRFWSWIEASRPTWVSIVPTIAALLLETERPEFLPGDIHFFRSASAPLPLRVLREFEAKFDLPLVETYGLTETASTVFANPVPPDKRKPGSVGLPVEGITARVVRQRMPESEPDLRALPQGETGEICLAGPSVITAYVGGAGEDSFQDGRLRTGDLGYLDEDGHLFITGRVRDVIIRGGENIAPREVEEVLLEHPAVEDSAVVGRPDPLYGEQVVAYVVPRHPWSADLAEALQAFAAGQLSRPQVPTRFVPVQALPRNPTGKVDREVLRREQREAADTPGACGERVAAR
jgi:acyl-CoA synthetase (AMP-forming)/AMP-acid ligase II